MNNSYPFARYHVVEASDRDTADQWVRDNVPGGERYSSTFSVPLCPPQNKSPTHYACSWMATCPYLYISGEDASRKKFQEFINERSLERLDPEDSKNQIDDRR